LIFFSVYLHQLSLDPIQNLDKIFLKILFYFFGFAVSREFNTPLVPDVQKKEIF